MTQATKSLSFSDLPSVDKLLNSEDFKSLLTDYGHTLVSQEVRAIIDGLRQQIRQQESLAIDLTADDSLSQFAQATRQNLELKNRSKLRSVFNLTGIVLHTNLGRALLPEVAVEAVIEAMRNPMNLEYDLASGGRGDRDDLVEDLLCELTGAEAATVVNNNAAAVLLVLSTFAKDEEVIVSRGELVEVGGAFRIPSVMSMSGAKLVEVGSTNKTRISDYEEAITENTKLLMKVHTSNYKMIGFTESVSNKELKSLGEKYDLPVVEDLGSGVYFDLEEFGLRHEPTIKESIKSGIDLVTFSGDKLLGGPQAGVIVGKKEYIDKMKKNQLLRALRVDKITLASLEATLKLYFDEEKAKKEIPTMRMISYTVEELEEKARILKRIIEEKNTSVKLDIKDEFSTVGGGSMPGEEFPTKVLVISSEKYSVSKIEEKLRLSKSHIIGRVKDNNYMLDLRTIQNSEFEIIAEEIEKNLK